MTNPAICWPFERGTASGRSHSISVGADFLRNGSHSGTEKAGSVFVSFSKATDLIAQLIISSQFIREMQIVPTPWVKVFQEKLSKFVDLSVGWDTYDAPPPAPAAIEAASKFLDHLWKTRPSFAPTRIAPTVDGSVVVSFLDDETRANIEFFDSGEIAAMRARAKEEPHIWGIGDDEESFDDAIESLSNAFKGRSST